MSCGDSGSDADTIVGAGDARGTGRTVWFVSDPQRVARLTGCKLPVSSTDVGHCGPPATDRMTWALSGDKLSFTDYKGELTNPIEWIGGPWRKIA